MTDKTYDNTNRGVLFKNKEKQSETSPDYTGSVNVDGTELWLNGWLQTSKQGEKYFSLSVKPKTGVPSAVKAKTPTPEEDDANLPF